MRNSTYFGNMVFTQQDGAWQVNLSCTDKNDQRWEIVIYAPTINQVATHAWDIYKSGDWTKYGKIVEYKESAVIFEKTPFGTKSFGQIVLQAKDDSIDWRSFVVFKNNKDNERELRGYGSKPSEAVLEVLDKYSRFHDKINKNAI